MNKKPKTQLQLLLVAFLISAVVSLLVAWIGSDVFGLSPVITFVFILVLVLVPACLAVQKIPIDDTGNIEVREISSNRPSKSDLVADAPHEDKSTGIHRIIVRGLLLGIFCLVTMSTIAAVKLMSSMGAHGLYTMIEENALLDDALAVGGSLVIGILVASILEAADRWKY